LQHIQSSYGKDVIEEVEETIALGKGGMMLSLRYGAAVGNYELMRELLVQGVDPNITDHSGKTALVIFFEISVSYCR
jgi:ankyrin repeat protein